MVSCAQVGLYPVHLSLVSCAQVSVGSSGTRSRKLDGVNCQACKTTLHFSHSHQLVSLWASQKWIGFYPSRYIVLFCSISTDGEVKSFKHNCTWPTMAAINDRDTYRPTGSWKSGQKCGCPCSILDCSLHISDITFITWLIIINSQNSKKTYPDHIHHVQRLLNLFSFPPRRHGHCTDWGCWNQFDLSRFQEALVVGPFVEVYSCIRFNCWHSIRYLFFSWLRYRWPTQFDDLHRFTHSIMVILHTYVKLPGATCPNNQLDFWVA